MTEKNKGGRPAYQYKEEQAKLVQALAQYGVPQDDISAQLEMDTETMIRLYRTEWRKGRAIANAKVGQKLFEKASSGDTTALIFWAKTQMGWSEKQKLDITTDGSMQPTVKVDKQEFERLAKELLSEI